MTNFAAALKEMTVTEKQNSWCVAHDIKIERNYQDYLQFSYQICPKSKFVVFAGTAHKDLERGWVMSFVFEDRFGEGSQWQGADMTLHNAMKMLKNRTDYYRVQEKEQKSAK